jgi:hypothetical protein
MESKQSMKQPTTREIQELLYKRVVEEKKWNRGLDFEEALKEVNAKAHSKYQHNAQNLLKMGKQTTGKTPMTFITDGLYAYNEAFRKEFSRKQAPRPRHIRQITLNGRVHNNNKMERLNGEIRDREKVIRGIKSKDSPLFKGAQIYHNYIRSHMGLNGDTPADRAGIKIDGENKWLTIIQKATSLNRNKDALIS